MEEEPNAYRDRGIPAHGVHAVPGAGTIVFVTACTKERSPWLADPIVHTALRATWLGVRTWVVGRYVIMPDHVHFFASPGIMDDSLEKWMAHWKRVVSRALGDAGGKWQRSHWDTRLRTGAAYDAKWEYVVENPVRKGLVARAEDWPYAGELHHLQW